MLYSYHVVGSRSTGVVGCSGDEEEVEVRDPKSNLKPKSCLCGEISRFFVSPKADAKISSPKSCDLWLLT